MLDYHPVKTLKFHRDLVPLVLEGRKNSTWRLFDDKNLQVGNDIELLVFGENKPFARAKILEVTKKTFSELTPTDKQGHEEYTNDEEMYETYSTYYKTSVGPKTVLKIIRFKLLD